MLVEYVKPNVLTLPVTGKKGEMLKNVQLAPGINQVAKKDWDICKNLPKIKRLVADGKIKVCVNSDDSENEFAINKVQVKEAVAVVKKTLNIVLLEEWLLSETRPSLVKAIKEQITLIQTKTAKKAEAANA